jgi:hypothetical protein
LQVVSFLQVSQHNALSYAFLFSAYAQDAPHLDLNGKGKETTENIAGSFGKQALGRRI